ncbi:hypothetical protein QCA50_011657 [Cerrena zonata]|uniref:F-box domain-containing protein n=1 Tax=Cerrena zonata TaxID=2478898 RepID=A0AAW0G1R7_9APHY
MSASMSNSSSHIPFDVQLEILEYVKHDKNLLPTFSLVCRDWMPYCQKHLFKHINATSLDAQDKASWTSGNQVLNEGTVHTWNWNIIPPHLASLVKNVTIKPPSAFWDSHCMPISISCEPLVSMLENLVNLETLALKYLLFGGYDGFELVHIPNRHQLRLLDIDDCVGESRWHNFFSVFSRINNLKFRCFRFPASKGFDDPLHRHDKSRTRVSQISARSVNLAKLDLHISLADLKSLRIFCRSTSLISMDDSFELLEHPELALDDLLIDMCQWEWFKVLPWGTIQHAFDLQTKVPSFRLAVPFSFYSILEHPQMEMEIPRGIRYIIIRVLLPLFGFGERSWSVRRHWQSWAQCLDSLPALSHLTVTVEAQEETFCYEASATNRMDHVKEVMGIIEIELKRFRTRGILHVEDITDREDDFIL